MVEEHLLNNRYQLQKSLGTGGMAMVYQARDLMLERKVAIKILREDFSSNPEFRERFRQEARAAANLSHPSIVTIHDFGLDQGRLFIVMENVPGTNLKSMLQKRGRFSIEETIQLIVQACAGIGYAHRAGLIHCDVKPHNMLVTPDRRLKVTDFGIARALASIHPDEHINVVWGSPQYFSPEQASGAAPSPASDAYSLGIVLYEMLTGQLPFMATTASELARMHREAIPVSPRNLNPAISIELEQIILKVLSKEPSSRYRTADQLGRVLLNIHTSTPSGVQERAEINLEEAVITPELSSSRKAISVDKPARSEIVETHHERGESSEENPLDIDWTTWILGLLALLAVGGLVPLALWVYLVYFPPAP